MTELYREVRRHAHDDRLLDLCGGLQSTIARLDALLVRYAPPAADGPSVEAAELVEAVLGIIAIRERLATAFAATPCDADDGSAPRSARPESLLR